MNDLHTIFSNDVGLYISIFNSGLYGKKHKYLTQDIKLFLVIDSNIYIIELK